MKITKGQTALIVMAIAGVLGGLFLVNIIMVLPIQAILFAVACIGIGVGYYMYRRNKDK